ncbi:caspase family protein [Bacteroidota bacterium]
MKSFRFPLLLAMFCSALVAQTQDYPVETVIQTGHYAAVTSVAFSPDGRFTATGSSDKTVKLWEASTGREIRSYLGHTHDIRYIAFAPDGKLLASIDRDYHLKIWEIPTSKELHDIFIPGVRILSLVFHPDGTSIIAGTERNHAIRFSLEDGSELQRFRPDTADINMQKNFGYPTARSLDISPDNKTLLTGSSDRTAFLFDLRTGKQIRKFKSDRTSCTSCSIDAHFSPSGEEIVAGNMDSVFIWKTASAQVVRTMKGRKGRWGEAYFSSDGKYIISTLFGDCYIWNASTGEQAAVLEGHLRDIADIGIHPSKNLVITGSEDRTAKIWGIPSGKQVLSLQGYLNDIDEKILGDGYMYWVAFMNEIKMSPDGKYAAIGKMGNLAKLYNFYTGKPVQVFRGHEGIVISLDFSPDGKYLATGAADGTARVWDVETGKMMQSLPEKTANIPCFSVDFSPNGKLLATGSWDGIVRIWEVGTGRLIQRIRAHEDVSPYSVQFSHSGLYVISGGLDRKLKMFEIDTGEEVREFIGHTNVVSAVRRHPDKDRIITASWDGKAKLWDLATGMQLMKFTAHEARVQCLDIDETGKYMVTGSDDNTAKLWDISSGEVIRTFVGHKGTVSSVIIDSTGQWLMTGSHDGTLKSWNLQTGELFLTWIFMGENDWMVSTSDGHFDASEGARKSIFFVQGTKIFNIDQFFDEFYKPGLLEERMKVTEPSGREPAFREGSIQERLKQSPPPTVTIVTPTNLDTISTPITTLNVNLTNRGGGINEIRVLNNGKRIPVDSEEVRKLKKEGKSMDQSIQVNLAPGRNTLQVSAYSEGRIESFPSVVQLFYDGKGQVINCYLLAIGINEYENPALNLNYAKEDAKAFSKAIEEQGKSIFKNVEILSLYDREATRENILSSLEELSRKVRPEDVFIFFYAGHGSMVDNTFYFIPTENVSLYQVDRLTKESIKADIMQEKFRNISALKQVVVLDACQSGGSAEILAQRGAMEEKAMAQLSRSSGIHVMAAAGSEQYATEVGSLGHGLFTYAILEALDGGADGAPRDGNVTIYELKAYLNDQVPELSREHKGSIQWPYTFSIGHDFPLIRRKNPPQPNQ